MRRRRRPPAEPGLRIHLTYGGGRRLAAILFCTLLLACHAAWGREPPDQRHPRHLQPGPPDPALYDFKPASFPAGLPAIAPRGPGAAKGLVIWNHGRDVNAQAADVAPPILWEMARQGWDVYTQHRLGTHDVLNVALRIVGAGLDAGQALGYRRILLAGQSVGGWLALGETARRDQPGQVRPETVLALAPAAYGTPDGPMDWRRNDSGLRAIWDAMRGQDTALMLAFFADDPFFERSEPASRGPWAQRRLGELGLPALVLDRPAPELLRGHAAGMTLPFARRFSPCLVLLAEQRKPPPCQDGERAAITTFGLTAPAAAAQVPTGPGSDALAGLWQGTSGNGRYLLLHLGPLLPGQQREASYGIGRSLNNEAASQQRLSLTSEGSRLRWAQGTQSLDVQRQPDGRLRLHLQNGDQPAAESWLRRLN